MEKNSSTFRMPLVLYPRSSRLPQKIAHSKDAVDVINRMTEGDVELESSYLVLFLSRTHRLKGSVRRRVTITTKAEHVALQMAKYALQTKAVAVVICSMRIGESCIYPDDRKTFRVFHSVMNQCAILVIDYIVVTQEHYVSFVDCGEMPQ